jgi:hypothetical protein
MSLLIRQLAIKMAGSSAQLKQRGQIKPVARGRPGAFALPKPSGRLAAASFVIDNCREQNLNLL